MQDLHAAVVLVEHSEDDREHAVEVGCRVGQRLRQVAEVVPGRVGGPDPGGPHLGGSVVGVRPTRPARRRVSSPRSSRRTSLSPHRVPPAPGPTQGASPAVEDGRVEHGRRAGGRTVPSPPDAVAEPGVDPPVVGCRIGGSGGVRSGSPHGWVDLPLDGAGRLSTWEWARRSPHWASRRRSTTRLASRTNQAKIKAAVKKVQERRRPR